MNMMFPGVKFSRRPLTLIASFVLIAVFMTENTRAEETRYPDIIRVGYSAKLFADVDIRDVQAAMDLWAKELNRMVGVNTFPKSIIFTDMASMVEAVKQHKVDMLSLSALDYLSVKDKLPLEPTFVASNGVDNRQERVLLVRKDEGITKVAQLKGRVLAVLSRSRDEVSFIWLDVVLAREGIHERVNFFSTIREATKASQAILPVFFHQVDAAIVPRSAFETMIALNPQIGQEIGVLASSKNLLGNIACFHRDLDSGLKKRIIEKAPRLHESPGMGQMFTLLKTDRIVLFQPSYLDSLADLVREHSELTMRVVKRR
jgi:ABC-type phosphate/phosphonate transport system substrate-binding protein